MLTRNRHDNGVVTWQAPRLAALGVTHAFTTRIGGVSPGDFASLNLGQAGCLGQDQGDQPEHIQANITRLQTALQVEQARVVRVRQVHGKDVAVVAGPLPVGTEADAMVAFEPGLLLMIRVADCVPILLADLQGRAVAAIHAGWRGCVAGVVQATVATLQQRGVMPADLVAAVGPCISVQHFEVGPEVADAFEQAGLAQAVMHQPGRRPHVDLSAAVVRQLTAAGIWPQAIDTSTTCTYADVEHCFSHRRDRGRTGRLAAVIARPNV